MLERRFGSLKPQRKCTTENNPLPSRASGFVHGREADIWGTQFALNEWH